LTCFTSPSVSPGSSRCGESLRLAIALRAKGKAMFDYILSGIVSILLLIYLSWAMFQPEKF
jgi:K+-transporting ATPase KdpF subunit